MQRFFLESGLVILREGRYLEFKHRSDLNLYFEDPFTGDIQTLTEEAFWNEFETKALTIANARSTPTALELPLKDAQPSLPIALDEAYEKDYLRKSDYIAGMKKRGITKGQLDLIAEAIVEIAAEIGDRQRPSQYTVAAWMRALEDANGDDAVLVSGYAKTIVRHRLHPEHEELIRNVINDHLAKLPATKIWEDHYLMEIKALNADRAEMHRPPFRPISERTLSRRIEMLDRYDIEVARHGRQEARRTFRMVKGHMPADRPREFVEIDHARLRLWVVDDKLLLPLGRPWVTALKDRYSGMLLGFFVSFRGPSLYSTFRALRHSLRNHLDLYKTWPDIENRWVAFGPACTYVSDRGSDFLSDHYRYAIRRLNADYSYCESRTPWHKPYIERTFLSLHADLLEALPGEVFKGVSYSRDYNPKEDAVVRFSTLIFLLVKWAVDYQPFRTIGARGARAIDLWMDGIGDSPIGYMPNPDALDVVLGRRYTVKLGNQGIRFKDLRYANDELEELFRAKYRKPITFIPCEENLGRVHAEDPRDKRWFEVESTRPDYAEGLSLHQHQYIQRQAKLDGVSLDTVEQKLRYREQLQARLAEDLSRKDNATKAKLARYCGIDSDSVLSGQARSLDNLKSPDLTGDTAHKVGGNGSSNKIPVVDAPFSDVPIFDWRVL